MSDADALLRLALDEGALKFGEFRLKSGRVSPYFFNLGMVSRGSALRELGRLYARALEAWGEPFDMLFGPAYKGIPLVASVAVALAERGRDVPYAYNRKEAKDHGEGGVLVGAPPRGRVVVVDDVLTAGTALREAVGLLRGAGATPVAAVLALDRQEAGSGGRSAVAEAESELDLRVLALATARDLVMHVSRTGGDPRVLQAIRDYQARYGVN